MSEMRFWEASPKSTFVMGLLLGIAISAVIALIMVLTMMMGGGTFAARGNSGTIAAVTDPGTNTQPPAPAAAGPVKAVNEKEDHILGNKKAKVTLIEYSDFECPFCKRYLPTVKQAVAEFPNDVRLIYRHYPLSFHPNAQKAAEASECAAKLGGNDAFWKMHDKIFTMASLSMDAYVTAAKEIGLNEQKFRSCVDSGETAGRINTDASEGTAAGVEGTPATFVNGTLVSGAVPYETLKAAIQAAGGSK
ncbi:hypothetical protein FJZ48_03695 [Candidatus Uhrbacteria bacterium]|nr:hypothetical protein [Candidatus Uhrbacteria bacterium]